MRRSFLGLAFALAALPAAAGTFNPDSFQPSEMNANTREHILRTVKPMFREGCRLWVAGYPQPPVGDDRRSGWGLCKTIGWGDTVAGGTDEARNRMGSPCYTYYGGMFCGRRW